MEITGGKHRDYPCYPVTCVTSLPVLPRYLCYLVTCVTCVTSVPVLPRCLGYLVTSLACCHMIEEFTIV